MKDVILAFDLGGTNLKYGLGSFNGEILQHSKMKSGGFGTLDSVTQPFIEAAEKMDREAKENGFIIKAIGIGTPGAVEPETGIVLGSSPNIPSIIGVSLKAMLEEETGIPCIVDNDANLATLGEALAGAGVGYKSVIGITLGTGVGGGFVNEGVLYRGAYGSAMEIGHSVIDYSGRLCNCGIAGCLEAYSGGLALIKRANDLGKVQFGDDARRFIKSRPLFEAAKEGYIPAVISISEGVDALAVGISNFINTLDPGCVVIGGGVVFGYQLYWDVLTSKIDEKVVDALTGKVPILPAKLGNKAGLAGAVLAAVKYLEGHK